MADFKNQFTLRLDLIVQAKIKKMAREENRSMANMIETLLKKAIQSYERENGEITLTEEEIYPK